VSKKLTINSYRKNYNLHIFSKKDSQKLEDIIFKASNKSFLVIDENVNRLYPHIQNYWDNDKIFVIRACEENKTLEKCSDLIDKLIKKGFKKDHRLVAVGGGVIQDIVAFSSSILYRGVDWIFFPTTLLAQSDSCIGSKTSINFSSTKNLLGTFFPPSEIYCFSNFLDTLSIEDIKSGIGEILHYYFVDRNKNIDLLNRQYNKLLSDRSLLSNHILESLLIKKKMVEIDEFDDNKRRVFNYGHTFGHALEVISEFKVLHGLAVTRGMDIANYVAFRLGMIRESNYRSMKESLKKNIPDYKMKPENIENYMSLLRKDKKSTSTSIRCVLPSSTGFMKLVSIENSNDLSEIIKDYLDKEW